MSLKIGVDVDGVLADFNQTFIERVVGVTGRDLFPARPFEITTWNYPESYGYTAEEVAEVWHVIKSDPRFWSSLRGYDDAFASLKYLRERRDWMADDVYFVTARPGIQAKYQTERWLRDHGWTGTPTVLITSHKGLAARTLGLEVYIDDRWENALEVAQTGAATFLLNRSWNTGHDVAGTGIIRVDALVGMVERRVAAGVATPGIQTSAKVA